MIPNAPACLISGGRINLMYLCSICRTCSQPGQPRRLHVITRLSNRHAFDPGTEEIAAELPVCTACDDLLQCGMSLDTVREMRGVEPVRPAVILPPLPTAPIVAVPKSAGPVVFGRR